MPRAKKQKEIRETRVEYTQLLEAVNAGNLADVTEILKTCDPNTKDPDIQKPLHLALAHNRKDIVNALLIAGADPNSACWVSSREGEEPSFVTALRYACELDDEMIALIKPFCNEDTIAETFQYVQGEWMAKALKIFDKHKTDEELIDAVDIFENAEKMIKILDRERWTIILSQERDTWERRRNIQIKGNILKLKKLIKDRENPNIKDKNEVLPLFHAVRLGSEEAVRSLLAAGANPNLPTGADIKEESLISVDPEYPLTLACQLGFNNIVNLLISYGARVNIYDQQNGCTPLMVATEWNKEDIVATLLEHDADVDLEDLQGRTAIEMVDFKNHRMVNVYKTWDETIVEDEIKRREKVKQLHEAISDPEIDIDEFQKILADADANAIYAGLTPLTRAMLAGRSDIIKLLLDAHANPNFCNRRLQGNEVSSISIYYYLFTSGNYHLLPLLLARGAPIEINNLINMVKIQPSIKSYFIQGLEERKKHHDEFEDPEADRINTEKLLTILKNTSQTKLLEEALSEDPQDIKKIETILNEGATPFLLEQGGLLAITQALENNRFDVVRLLLTYGAAPDYYLEQKNKLYTALKDLPVNMETLNGIFANGFPILQFDAFLLLTLAINTEQLEVVELILEQEPDFGNFTGWIKTADHTFHEIQILTYACYATKNLAIIKRIAEIVTPEDRLKVIQKLEQGLLKSKDAAQNERITNIINILKAEPEKKKKKKKATKPSVPPIAKGAATVSAADKEKQDRVEREKKEKQKEINELTGKKDNFLKEVEAYQKKLEDLIKDMKASRQYIVDHSQQDKKAKEIVDVFEKLLDKSKLKGKNKEQKADLLADNAKNVLKKYIDILENQKDKKIHELLNDIKKAFDTNLEDDKQKSKAQLRLKELKDYFLNLQIDVNLDIDKPASKRPEVKRIEVECRKASKIFNVPEQRIQTSKDMRAQIYRAETAAAAAPALAQDVIRERAQAAKRAAERAARQAASAALVKPIIDELESTAPVPERVEAVKEKRKSPLPPSVSVAKKPIHTSALFSPPSSRMLAGIPPQYVWKIVPKQDKRDKVPRITIGKITTFIKELNEKVAASANIHEKIINLQALVIFLSQIIRSILFSKGAEASKGKKLDNLFLHSILSERLCLNSHEPEDVIEKRLLKITELTDLVQAKINVYFTVNDATSFNELNQLLEGRISSALKPDPISGEAAITTCALFDKNSKKAQNHFSLCNGYLQEFLAEFRDEKGSIKKPQLSRANDLIVIIVEHFNAALSLGTDERKTISNQFLGKPEAEKITVLRAYVDRICFLNEIPDNLKNLFLNLSVVLWDLNYFRNKEAHEGRLDVDTLNKIADRIAPIYLESTPEPQRGPGPASV